MQQGDGRSEDPTAGSSRPQPETRVCFHCGRRGHLRRDCPFNGARRPLADTSSSDDDDQFPATLPPVEHQQQPAYLPRANGNVERDHANFQTQLAELREEVGRLQDETDAAEATTGRALGELRERSSSPEVGAGPGQPRQEYWGNPEPVQPERPRSPSRRVLPRGQRRRSEDLFPRDFYEQHRPELNHLRPRFLLDYEIRELDDHGRIERVPVVRRGEGQVVDPVLARVGITANLEYDPWRPQAIYPEVDPNHVPAPRNFHPPTNAEIIARASRGVIDHGDITTEYERRLGRRFGFPRRVERLYEEYQFIRYVDGILAVDRLFFSTLTATVVHRKQEVGGAAISGPSGASVQVGADVNQLTTTTVNPK
eukprot:g13866.t1